MQRQTSQDLYDTTKALDTRVSSFESNKRIKQSMPVINVSEDTPSDINEPKAPLNPMASHFIGDQQLRPSYAAMTQLNGGHNSNGNVIIDSDGFIVVGPNGKPVRPVSNYQQRPNSQANQKYPNQGMVGNSTRSGIEAATRIVKASVFVSRYPPGTTVDEVKKDLMMDPRMKDLDLQVEQVKTKFDTYTSFHVTCVCKEKEAQLFIGPDLWPRGILYRPWKEKRKFNVQGTGGFNVQGQGSFNNHINGRGYFNGNSGFNGQRRGSFNGYGGGGFG